MFDPRKRDHEPVLGSGSVWPQDTSGTAASAVRSVELAESTGEGAGATRLLIKLTHYPALDLRRQSILL